MNEIVGEDAVRRAFAAIGKDEGAVWLRRHLDYCTASLLAEPWILDIDTTVTPLYGHREVRLSATIPRSQGGRAMSSNNDTGQQQLSFVDVDAGTEVHEYSVLATSLREELVSFGQL